MKTHSPTVGSYIIGFAGSLALTILAFWLVAKHIDSGHTWPSHSYVSYLLIGIAGVQFIVQIIYFLHLSFSKEQRLNTALFASTIALVLVVVIGSIWIMNNLNYNMTPAEMNARNLKQEGIRHD